MFVSEKGFKYFLENAFFVIIWIFHLFHVFFFVKMFRAKCRRLTSFLEIHDPAFRTKRCSAFSRRWIDRDAGHTIRDSETFQRELIMCLLHEICPYMFCICLFLHFFNGTIIIIACPNPGYKLRSEEHTSELQSRFDLVCRLLLQE